jgi:hypothetical protein
LDVPEEAFGGEESSESMILIEKLTISPTIISFSFNSIRRQSSRIVEVVENVIQEEDEKKEEVPDEDEPLLRYLRHTPASAIFLNISDASFQFNGLLFRSVFAKKDEVLERVQAHYSDVLKYQLFKVDLFFNYF